MTQASKTFPDIVREIDTSYFGVAKIAERMGCGYWQAYYLIRTGRIPVTRISPRVIIARESEISRLLASGFDFDTAARDVAEARARPHAPKAAPRPPRKRRR